MAMAGAQGGVPDAAMARPATQTMQAASADKTQNLYRGSRIIGATIRDVRDKKLGVIKDIILDGERGAVAYAVVSFGGVTGPGGKYHAIPWKILQAGEGGKYYVLHANDRTIENAPSFDPRRWPDMADQRWSAEAERYWNSMAGNAPQSGVSPNSGANTASGAKASGAIGSGIIREGGGR